MSGLDTFDTQPYAVADLGGTKAESDLLRYLQEKAPYVSYFQALTLLEQLFPHSAPIGHDGPVADEALRLRPSLRLSIPPSDIEEISTTDDRQRVQVTATFLGLYGIDSPLPPTYGEHLARLADERAGERIRAFLDVFHHRLYSLLYRVWRRSRPVLTGRGVNPLYDQLLAMVGFSSELGIGGKSLPRPAEARLKVLRARTAGGLRALLKLRLGFDCRVDQMRPRMCAISHEQRSRLGQANCALGTTAVIGARIADRNKIRLFLEAEDLEMWLDLAPGGEQRQRLDEAVDDYVGYPIDRDTEIRMDAQQVPPLQLGSRDAALGQATWLGCPQDEARWQWPHRA